MKLLKMELQNFRQYMGNQTIEFADGEQNITIVFGENGKGKTGIFRALMYALYGSTHIQQDNPKEPVHLVSFRLLEDSKRPVETYVRVTFEHLGRKFEVTRTLKGIKRGERIEERFSSVKLVAFDENGNYGAQVLDDEIQVRAKMNDILDEEIKDFFLFDAEKIDTLAKTTDDVKKEVRTAISKLLQINNLEEAKNIIERLQRTEKKNIIENAGNTDIDSKEREIEEKTAEMDQQKALQQALIVEQNECKKLIDQYELQLSENEDIRRVQDQLKGLRNTLSSKVEYLEDLKSQLNEKLRTDAAFLLMNATFPNVTNYLEQLTLDDGSIVPADVLDLSLNQQKCACCNNDLAVHKENMIYVQTLRDNYRRSELMSLSSSIKNLITEKQNTYDQSEQSIVELLRKIHLKDTERKELIREIEVVEADIGTKAGKELHLEEIKNALEAQREKESETRLKIARTKDAIEQAEKQLASLEAELSDMFKNTQSVAFDSKVLKYIESIHQDIKDMTEEFSSAMRHNLSELTTDIFKRLIDRKDVNLISKININHKFELEIIGQEGIEITQDISQGQRQIVALAFITALAQIASGDNILINFPLFMDSPFNRLSGNNRDQLIVNIPTLTSQWILLLTDTELSSEEERVFKENNKLGKFYRIVQRDVMDAIIEPVALHEPLTTRGL
ncbi:AAA family ATPase [Kurthia massiliensis]|uniref:AAA family ATPase n=1 Tax=Kurthia massiliensis TaxID=1033739 RepID=UPI000288C13C|nr:AAA family ATPase [Kurthia massiliensis]